MIRFMVIGLPRSGTAWAANWLTTDTSLCLHDPLFERHYSELDAINSRKRLGVSCTGLFNWPDWLNAHPARKIVLHRPLREINESLEQCGLANMDEEAVRKLERVNGRHFDWRAIFDDPATIYEYLIEKPFDPERHAELVKLNVQRDFGRIVVSKQVTKMLMQEVMAA